MALVPWRRIHWKSLLQKTEHCSDYDTRLARMQVGHSMYLVERDKVYTAALKAQVALDLLKEETSLAQISAEYAVHANVLREWRTQALKGLATISVCISPVSEQRVILMRRPVHDLTHRDLVSACPRAPR
jgi:hypothetical protein